MATRHQNSFEGYFSLYKISLNLIQNKLTITCEHRHTKRIYRIEIDEKYIHSMTQGLCETCNHLFDIFYELINNNENDKNKIEVMDSKIKLILNVIVTMSFGKISRQFNLKFELESIQLDDITRLEDIINEQSQRIEELEWNMNDRFNNATKLVSLYNNFKFRTLSSAEDVSVFNNNHKASLNVRDDFDEEMEDIRCKSMSSRVTKQDAIIVANQPFVISSNKRYQLIRFNVHLSHPLKTVKLLVGVIRKPENKSWSNIAPSSDTWLLDIPNGSIQHSYLPDHPYTWPLNKSSFYNFSSVSDNIDRYERTGYNNNTNSHQNDLIIHVDLLFDTYKHCLAFRVEDQTEDKWAFYLPKELKINQLYPFAIFDSAKISISIDFKNK